MPKAHKPKTRDHVLIAIEENWPASVTDIATILGEMNQKKKISGIAKIKYHFDQLAKEEKIRTKKIGRNLVAWPSEIEKLRLIHEMVR